MEFQKKLAGRNTPIPGVIVYDIPVFGDNRGWFKENWQREKMVALGLPDFCPVQNNISFNDKAGTTRGIHAEPWDKFVSVAAGRIFGAWVDLRVGPSFGAVFTAELDASKAIFIPRGVANSYQTLEDDTAYVYLVNDHWSPEAEYTFLNVADETVNISWPIPLERAEVSEKDLRHPRLSGVIPMAPRKTLVLGADGQLGRALRKIYEGDDSVEFATRDEFDLLDAQSYSNRHWPNYSTIINAAAYTAVDSAESRAGREMAWAINATAVRNLARIAAKNRLTLVHVSSDYVFDGLVAVHPEDEPFAPLNVYGQSKAAGDTAASTAPSHYIVRTSWVIGEGKNFVQAMAALAERGVRPEVVNDQVGRLTFTEDIARAIRHLLSTNAPYGTYNLSNDGVPQSWADIAADVFELCGADRSFVSGVSSTEYFKGKQAAIRPMNSVLDLDKIKSTGFTPRDSRSALVEFLNPKLP